MGLRSATYLWPRLTWRYILTASLVIYTTLRFLMVAPFTSTNLPPYTGPHSVGTIDVELPCDSRIVHGAVFKKNGQPAFKLDTVLFSLYYPAAHGSVSIRPQHNWMPRPISLTAEGYARFAHINNIITNSLLTAALYLRVGSNKVPAGVDVPLLQASDRTHPVIIFSHGAASSRTGYTQLCGELASRGYIVAAIEHRDGSGPGSMITMSDGSTRKRFHISAKSLMLNGDSIDKDEFKRAQLAFRQAEVKETVRIVKALHKGFGYETYMANRRGEGLTFSSWSGQVNVKEMTIAGHSYGATLAMQTLRDGPSDQFPFRGAIVLDPSGKHSGRLNDDIRVPTLIIHSNSWSAARSIFFGRAHFEVVKDIARSVNKAGHKAWFMTSVGTSHPSVTDAPLIEPTLLSWTTGSTINVYEGLRQYVDVCTGFLRYQHEGIETGLLEGPANAPEYIERPKTKKYACESYWQIHVAPEE